MGAGLVFRLVGLVLLALLGWQIGSIIGPDSAQPRNAILGIVIGAVIGAVSAPIIIAWPYHTIRRLLRSLPAADLLYAILGLILGLIVAALLSYPLSFLPWWFGHTLPALVAIIFAYLGVSLMLMRHPDLTGLIQSRFSTSNEQHEVAADRLLLDTSAIIDGRIADICKTGFVRGTLVVPRFVLHELQHIADSADPIRRARGRRGLEVLNTLRKEGKPAVEIADMDAREGTDVDSKLMVLARKTGSPIITNDFNMNRVAEVQGIAILNINQLANALKPIVLPGEEMEVHIIQEGRELNQGVAYLDDGTMIVVENGRRHIHGHVPVVVTRVLQTVAGRMIFAQIKSNGNGRE